MMLYVNGQDIERLVLGLGSVEGGVFTFGESFQTFPASPEMFLATIDGFLQTHHVSLDTLQGFVVVVGQGSMTSLRSSLSIVNTLAWARHLPIFTLEKLRDEQDDQSGTGESGTRTVTPVHGFALPVYDHAPKITRSTKNVLGL